MATGVFILIFIILVYYFATWNTNAQEKYLYGCWIAENDDFTDSAEIDSMMLFIGEPEAKGWLGGQRRLGYIVITPDMYNGGLTLDYSRGWSGVGVGKYTIRASVAFDDTPLWDPVVTVTINMIKGTMKIHSGDTVFARLHKQHDITNTAAVLEN
jgi:hypothetical protein